jgi:sigma-B regulation protein RsbU (phosphoserine phosphatase)
VFCESTLPTHYATLVCGRASDSGEVEVCNAGHPPPLLLRDSEIAHVEATGLPVGMFCHQTFSTRKAQLSPGSVLLLYTDGLSESRNEAEEEYGMDRLTRLVSECHASSPKELIHVCLKDLIAFRAGRPKADDLTIMAIRRG